MVYTLICPDEFQERAVQKLKINGAYKHIPFHKVDDISINNLTEVVVCCKRASKCNQLLTLCVGTRSTHT